MPIKKSDLYSSIWSSCDALRGGMDASQYKDYVLFMLFIKYISDKYAGKKYAPVTIPPGASFADMVALKGRPDIGDHINKHIIEKLADANRLSDLPDFNSTKLGAGKEKVERITDLITIFEHSALDFSQNRAENDDILGDAYEYLMRHFAQESGKSKGQFYTPSEVSRVIAKVIGITPANTTASTTAYDPACGSGSLLLKVAAETGKHFALYGQEKDETTAGLARMNGILHAFPTITIKQGNTLTDPKFQDGDALKTFDYVVANPPFSDKKWRTGLPADLIKDDPWQRFTWGEPPAKQGDYAYLLHIIRSMKSAGKAACILPHGVLFRGNAEEAIRARLIHSGILKGIIGLPANLFYGTGIPACILILDKDEKTNARAHNGIFMIDASKGYIKDGNKNRLREQDIHKITDTFTHRKQHPRYSRHVPLAEILDPKNAGNLNLPRYIDTTEPEDHQDIDAHLRGGIPQRDIDALAPYWTVLPALRDILFKPHTRPGYCELRLPLADFKRAIHDHPEFTLLTAGINRRHNRWKTEAAARLKTFAKNAHPKPLLDDLAEKLLADFKTTPLLDPYDIYQHYMDYRAATLQDDCYLIAADGWTAKPERILETKKAKDGKPGKTVDKGWKCDLIPKSYIVARYFSKEQKALDALTANLETTTAELAELEEEHGGDEGLLFESQDEEGTLTKASVKKRLSAAEEGGIDVAAPGEIPLLKQWLELTDNIATLRKKIRQADDALDALALKKYPALTTDEIKTLVVDDKWMPALTQTLQTELDRLSQTLTARIRQLADRYAKPLPEITAEVETLAARVDAHLKKMGAVWN